jgi:hypothetical protein
MKRKKIIAKPTVRDNAKPTAEDTAAKRTAYHLMNEITVISKVKPGLK